MKTAISIPDKVFAEAERLAKRLKKSRSQLYSEAVAEYMQRHSENAITDSWNKVLAEEADAEDAAVAAFVAEAARRTFERNEW